MKMNEVEMIIKLIDDKKGYNIVAINVEEVTPISKYYVIASCKNERQTRSMADEIEDKLFENGLPFHHIEGRNGDGKWMLVDAEDVVFHIINPLKFYLHLNEVNLPIIFLIYIFLFLLQ